MTALKAAKHAHMFLKQTAAHVSELLDARRWRRNRRRSRHNDAATAAAAADCRCSRHDGERELSVGAWLVQQQIEDNNRR